MTAKKHKIILLVWCAIAVSLLVSTFENPIQVAHNEKTKKEEAQRVEKDKREEAQRIENDKKAAEYALQQAKAEEKRQKQLAIRRANMPEFSFRGITLPDSPQQIIDKALSEYAITTSFPVQQSGTSIRVTKNDAYPVGGFVEGGSLLAEFLGHIPPGTGRYYLLNIPDCVKKSGLRFDYISLDDPKSSAAGRTQVRLFYYTLPGKSPVALYMNVIGEIVSNDVPAVYTERYGDPDEKKNGNRLSWLSDKGIASIMFSDLYVISKPAYEELSAYTKKIDAEEIAKRKTEQDALKSKI